MARRSTGVEQSASAIDTWDRQRFVDIRGDRAYTELADWEGGAELAKKRMKNKPLLKKIYDI